MNVYDFDKTIYDGDSSVDFYRFNLKQQPSLAVYWPLQSLALGAYGLKLIDKTAMKSQFYRYFQAIPDIDQRVAAFWQTHHTKLMPYYLSQKQSSDVIVSASPEFMLKPVCDQLGVTLIASVVDARTGHSATNCYGAEKVRRFRALYPTAKVSAFYSDSRSDQPLADEAERAFLVVGRTVIPWPKD
jgi:phosphatidylglycerophosphatase C